jgi:hypothetical protein
MRSSPMDMPEEEIRDIAGSITPDSSLQGAQPAHPTPIQHRDASSAVMSSSPLNLPADISCHLCTTVSRRPRSFEELKEKDTPAACSQCLLRKYHG